MQGDKHAEIALFSLLACSALRLPNRCLGGVVPCDATLKVLYACCMRAVITNIYIA